MGLEEQTLPDSFERRCQVCGAELTGWEIYASREAGGPFLCSTHAAEDLPIAHEEETAGDDPGDPGERPPPVRVEREGLAGPPRPPSQRRPAGSPPHQRARRRPG